MDDVFWQGKRVLVTGADGFMGSHLTERLVGLGASVTALVRATSHSGTIHYRLKNIEHIAHRLKAIIGASTLGEMEALLARALSLRSEVEVEELVLGLMRRRFPLELATAGGDS